MLDESLREAMVEHQLVPRGIKDARVLEAMRRVPRERFVPDEAQARAYEDRALPIGQDQTISQPYMVAWMLQSLGLHGTEKILEVGTGSGYNAALLGGLAREVHTMEIVPSLADAARRRLAALAISNVQVYERDGSMGLPEEGPFDAILFAAAVPEAPLHLFPQLTPNGKLLLPLAHSEGKEMLTLFEKKGEEIIRHPLGGCVFVPLRGRFGWKDA
jgi:protein-L-isoaspartate(D-aspartate) O-methyltransferase